MANIKDKNNKKARLGIIITYLVLIIFTFLAIYPLLWLLINSFKSTTDFQLNKLWLPKKFVLYNYTEAWKRGNFLQLIVNSVIYTGVSTFFVVLLSLMAGFAFAKIPHRATKLLNGSFIIGLLLTLQSIMVPLYLMVNWVGLYNTRLGVLIPYIGIGMPLGVYLGTEYIKSIPNALVESARLDGAKYSKIFLSIIFPIAKPAAITLAILTVTTTWNEFMLINILTSNDAIKSLPVGIQKFAGELSTDYGKQFAALVIGLIPMLIFYYIFRKEITAGVSAGAVKG